MVTFRQYQEESSQKPDPSVVKKLHESLRGQPGLVCWFGELLTEKFNPGKDRSIGMEEWNLVWRKALYTEWNNTVLNLVKKAKNLYRKEVLDLFCHPDIQFSMDADWCAYLYLNGLISSKTVRDEKGENTEVCRFSVPWPRNRPRHIIFFFSYIPPESVCIFLSYHCVHPDSRDLHPEFFMPCLSVGDLIFKF